MPIFSRLVGICLVLESFVRKNEAARSACVLWETVEKCLSSGSKEGNEESFPLWVVNRWAMGWTSVMQWRVHGH